MANCAIVGINWGDEGKGRMVDYLTGQYDVVVRYQGGGNAGHTVINDRGKFALHLLPSGIFRPGVMNILGNGVALDCENLVTEMETIRSAGVGISPENLLVSHRASLLLPWHRELDALEEARLKDKMYGSTKQGIAPFYSDKYQKKTIQAGECRFVNDVLHSGERKKDGIGRLPVERAHGEIVVLSLPNSKLLGKVIKGIECVAGIEFFIIFPVAALHLAVMPWRKWFDLLVADAHLTQCFLKKRQRLFLAVAHFICKLKTIIRLDTFNGIGKLLCHML